MKTYIPLHVHSHFSLLDGLSKPEQIADRCYDIGAKSCALTDHGNIAGSVQFFTAMRKKNIKPILGCEIYVCGGGPKNKAKENGKLSHFLVLAKNLKGWQNLIRLISISNSPEHFYRKPRIDLNGLKEVCGPDLIGICGHLGSVLADKIVKDDTIIDDWQKIGLDCISEIKEIFGDNFFLESQLMDKYNNPIQIELTEKIRQLGYLSKTKVICTPDAHYCTKEDAVDQRVLLCNNLKTTFQNIQSKMDSDEEIGMSCFFTSDNFHILSQEEINELHNEEEIINTQYVDSLCEEYDITHKPMLPMFKCPKSYDDAEYLRQLCRDGWKEKIANNISKDEQNQYVDRVKYELDVLQGANLSSYFLIVQDIVNYVKNNNWLPGPGRGCFIPDTKVKMGDGTLKPIQQICVGNTVIDAYGDPQEVYDTLEYDIKEDIIELEFENGQIIRCTKDHKFLTNNRGWVEAEFLDDNDDIVEV